MDLEHEIRALDALIETHITYRADCLNLIASENRPSPLVERLLVDELDRHYGYYTGIDAGNREYPGNAHLIEIEEKVQELARQLFRAEYVDFRPLSGNIAGIIAAFGLGRPGDTVLEVENAHKYAEKLATSALKVDLKAISIPWDGPRYNIDLHRTVSLIEAHRPGLVIVGSAIFLFPQPVRELREAMDRHCPGSCLVYDAAHVMGLIAGGAFQSPLEEGADVIITSTHKTLAGPQGGMILANDRTVMERIAEATSPLMIANHHLSRLPSLAATFLEWLAHGPEHAGAIVSNAKCLGQALQDRGVPMVGVDQGFTESHTLLAIVDAFGESDTMARRLETCNILVNPLPLPEEVGTHGLRLGVQEVTRWGMTASDVPEVADCIVDALRGEDEDCVKRRVAELARRFDGIKWTIED
ncbi:MAG: hypothetical protein QGI83_16605 [Candidatus Latescibacteria bacterium]|jgi:glycine hydroxymethyltransferase|nr:hypothetical protein [Candidatus Latescibacterota bacterium]